MKTYRIATIPGDGIGNEVIPEGIKVLNTVAETLGGFSLQFDIFPWGCEYYLENGSMMPLDGLEKLAEFDAIYFGAVGFPNVPDWVSLRGLRLAICQGFDQYANVRPVVLLPGVSSPLANVSPGSLDFVIVRENTEGEYAGAGGRAHRGLKHEVATQTAVFSRLGTERIIRFAFELAMRRKRHVSSVTKSNAMEHAFGLWDEVFSEVALDYPQVSTERVLVDAMAARFILKPQDLDVVVASNLFADILSDLGAAIVGSLGMAPTANLNPDLHLPSMFEPIHGSAPDIFGKGIANPVAMIWCGAMMLEHLGEIEAADRIVSAIKTVIGSQNKRTPDLGGTATTVEIGDSIANAIRENGGD